MSGRVIGIGYQGLDMGGVLGRLRLHDVRTVIDVRLNAISRKRGLSKRQLAETLKAAGLEYKHLPALGNPRDNREGFADQVGPAGRAARERFGSGLSSPDAVAAIDQIIALASKGSVALLCFESDERTCHREVILRAVDQRRLVRA